MTTKKTTDSPLAVARAARLIARASMSGALATSRRAAQESGQPYVSKVGLALDLGGQPIFLFSTLAAHTQDLIADPRCSLLVEAPETTANPLESARATLVGQARKLRGREAEAAREAYLLRHPGAVLYADFGDFAFWRLAVDKIHYVAGFGTAKWVKARDYRVDPGNIGSVTTRIINDLNGPKKEELSLAMGQKCSFKAVLIDSDGALIAGPKGRMQRLDFPSPAKDARAWRTRFAACVKRKK